MRSLLVAAAVAATVTNAYAFQWEPVSLFPSTSMEVTSLYGAENVSFQCYGVDGVAITDVMPVWMDDEGNEFKAVSGIQDDFNPNLFNYQFNSSEFKDNGEYILLFPEGMLVNAAGEKSDKVENYYTFEIPELAPAMFDDFEILSVEPDLNQPQAIWTDQVLTVNTNHNEAIGVTNLSIIDTNTGEYVVSSSNFSTGRTLGDSSPIVWEVANTYKFFEGHTYKAELTFYNGKNEYSEDGVPTKVVARASYEFTGRVEGFKYSQIRLESVEPVPMSVVISEPSQAVFTYTFSGPVNVYKASTPLGQGGENVYPASCLSSNEDKTVWTLDLSEDSYIKSIDAVLTIYIYARDLDGFQLQGDWGEENESCFVREWECDLGGFPIVLVSPADGATVDSLAEVVVKAENGSPMSWSWMGMVRVLDQLGDELGTLVFDESALGEDSALEEFRFTKMMDASWNIVSLDELIAGSYTVYFEPGCFNMGDQFESKRSRSLSSSFTVAGVGADPQEALKYASVTPESGSTVEVIDEILLVYAEPVVCDDFEIYVLGADQSVAATGICRTDFMDNTMIVVQLNEPITKAGSYNVVIPAHNIINGDYFESDGKEGLCNPEYHLLYTIEGNDDPVVDPAEQEVFNYTEVSPADGSVVNELSSISLWFPDVVMTMDDIAYVYKADALESDPVSTASVNWTMTDDLLINVDLKTPVLEAGDYVVVIPARTISNLEYADSDGKNGICNPEIRLSYTVDPTSTAVEAVSVAAAVDVYDVHGRLVLHNASAADVKTLTKGIYVVGGRKVVVK
ncbi:MAG: hypothetical protein K2J58_05440 [Muribaculaceae bacterium]|nr:hypothetical protein [Muribaculaceae bacterium]